MYKRNKLYFQPIRAGVGTLKRILVVLMTLMLLTSCEPAKPAANSKLEGGIKSLRIAIDPGHGGIDHGATGKTTGVPEDTLNLEISKLLAKRFILAGADVLLTRESEDVVYAEEGNTKKRQDMNQRAKVVQQQNPHVLISIHMNMYSNSKYSGAQTFYDKGNEEGRQLAECIQRELIAGLSDDNKREVKTGDYFVLKITKSPSVLVECGFLSNAKEEKKLCDPDYQKKVADCIFQGICDYLGVQ
jgi:N-acetylmuramoyl-L-alanine amidase